jgi:hypothetical protein
LSKLKHADLWAERRKETRAGVVRGSVDQAPVKPERRARWAISAMLESRHISVRQYQAALRLARLIERATSARGARLDRVDGGGHATADAAYEAIMARLAAGDALAAVAGSDEWANRQRMIRAAFEWPQPTMHALVRLYYSDRSRNVKVVTGVLARACEALEAHWQAVDSGAYRRSVD